MGSSDNGVKQGGDVLEISKEYPDVAEYIDLTELRDNDFIEEDAFDEFVTDVMPQDEIAALRVPTETGRLEDLTLEYGGEQRTTTGVIRLMRDDGKEVIASLLEEMRETCQEMQRSLDGLKRLHKSRTGHYPVIEKRGSSSE